MDGACIEVQSDLNKLVQHVENAMKELTNDYLLEGGVPTSNLIMFASDDEVK